MSRTVAERTPSTWLSCGSSAPDTAMQLGPPIFLLIAMTGATVLARRLGAGAWGSWAAGAFYGFSGPLLSTVNFLELFHSASWAPWVVAAFLAFWTQPTRARIATLAALGGVQIAALSPEVLLQTGLFGLAPLPERPSARKVLGLAAALLMAALLAAPTLLGAHALVEGTARSIGFSHRVSFAWSARPILLLETVLPHFFGDMHTMTDVGAVGTSSVPHRESIPAEPLSWTGAPRPRRVRRVSWRSALRAGRARCSAGPRRSRTAGSGDGTLDDLAPSAHQIFLGVEPRLLSSRRARLGSCPRSGRPG